jgi:hypothetical protein
VAKPLAEVADANSGGSWKLASLFLQFRYDTPFFYLPSQS